MHGNQFSDSGERMCVRKDVSPEYFFVAALSLYKNVTDAKLASCIQLETSLSTDVFIRAPTTMYLWLVFLTSSQDVTHFVA